MVFITKSLLLVILIVRGKVLAEFCLIFLKQEQVSKQMKA